MPGKVVRGRGNLPSSRRGTQYGHKRSAPDKQKAKTRRRMQDSRVVEALTDAQREREELDRRAATRNADGAVEGREFYMLRMHEEALKEHRRWLRKNRPMPEKGELFSPWEGDGYDASSLGKARGMVRQGYHVKHVMERTGVGFKWLSDLGVQPDGRVKS